MAQLIALEPASRITAPGPGPGNPPPRLPILVLVLLAAGTALGTLLLFAGEQDFLVRKNGEPELSPTRQAKMDRELEALENAEQYALLAGTSGYFPCYSCGTESRIFLHFGEVWRYGTTGKGQEGRYPDGLPAGNLAYVTQFRGTLQECLREEKIKIYSYAVLPENLKRHQPLIRPPGNKMDR